MSDYPVLPYGSDGDRNSGWSGSATSQRRALENDASGLTGRRQRAVFDMVANAGERGMTDHEVQVASSIGHGASSAALSNLHKAGRIVRLREERSGNQVYVLPAHVNDRPVAPYRPNVTKMQLERQNEELRARVAELTEKVDALYATINSMGGVPRDMP